MHIDLEDERMLVERAKRDPEAFGILFEENYAAIFGYVIRRVAEWNTARDLTSEVFLKAFKGLWRFRWQGVSFSAWLYRIATNEVNMFFRKRRLSLVSLERMAEEVGFEPVDPKTLAAEAAAAERILREHADFLAIRAGILELPVKYQEVIALRYFERKSVREVAQILNKKEGTVKSLLSRGITKLKNLL